MTSQLLGFGDVFEGHADQWNQAESHSECKNKLVGHLQRSKPSHKVRHCSCGYQNWYNSHHGEYFQHDDCAKQYPFLPKWKTENVEQRRLAIIEEEPIEQDHNHSNACRYRKNRFKVVQIEFSEYPQNKRYRDHSKQW